MKVGDQVVTRRAELGLSRAELARRADVDPKTLQTLEQDRRWPQDVNRAKIEQALGWAPGSLEAIRDGGEPTTAVGDFADRFVRDLKPGDMAQFSERISKAIAPATIQGEGLRTAVDALLPKMDVSSFIPKGALEAVTAAALPAPVVQNIMRAAENSASELLPDLIEVLSVEQRARLTYEILDILEEQGVDVEKLLTEYDEKAGDGGTQPDDLAARHDSNTPPRSIRNVVDDDDPTAGIDPQRYAAHPKTDNIDVDNWD